MSEIDAAGVVRIDRLTRACKESTGTRFWDSIRNLSLLGALEFVVRIARASREGRR